MLGFASGSYSKWYKVLLFTRTEACGVSCANLKSTFFIAIILLVASTILSATATPEKRWSKAQAEAKVRAKAVGGKIHNPVDENDEDDEEQEADEETQETFIWELFSAFRDLPSPMLYLLIVTTLTWLAWFPFLLFDTDWMGHEVYKGKPFGPEPLPILYDEGVRLGSFGLMLNSIMLGATSLMIETMARRIGPKLLWAIANFILCLFLACTVIITKLAENHESVPPDNSVKIAALVVFAALGAPLAVCFILSPFDCYLGCYVYRYIISSF